MMDRDDVLKHVGVNGKEVQSGEDDLQQQNAYYVPLMRPIPPTKDTPPITQAAMASHS